MNVVVYSVLTIGIMGFTAGCLLFFASKKLSIVVDPRIEEIAEILPGSNCGACGYASCRALAKALAEGEASANSCIAGGSKTAEEVSKILGTSVDQGGMIKKIAVVRCRGGKGIAKERFQYKGIEDCKAALLVAGGHKACIYGCLGLGTCVRICPFSAMSMGKDGIPIIDEDKCTACGQCVKICPRGIITVIPKEQTIFLACVSRDKAKKVRDVCKAGCITCGICVRLTSEGIVTVAGSLPEIHWEKGRDLTQLMKQAVDKCPDKCFIVRK